MPPLPDTQQPQVNAHSSFYSQSPHWRMLLNPAHFLSLGFGTGLSPIAPGTVATLFAWLSFTILSHWLNTAHWLLIIVFGFILGIVVCKRTSKFLGEADHSAIVWDEIIAFWLILLFLTPTTISTEFWAFICFRCLDIFKPGPIRYIEEKLQGTEWRSACGAMLDDLLAAFFTLLLFALWFVL